MKNILTIFKKEFARVIRDRRLVLTIMILPGLMIYGMYSLMGNMLTDMSVKQDEHQAIILSVNMPEELKKVMTETEEPFNANFTDITENEVDSNKNKLITREADLIVVFEADFNTKAINSTPEAKPTFKVYFNPNEPNSANAYSTFMGFYGIYESQLIYEAHGDIQVAIQLKPEEIYDLAKSSGQGFGLLMPFMIIIFLFAGAMSIAPESIAGEKERGTIATLLITPVKRKEIAIGKVLSTSALAGISAVSSFIGIMGSLPKLMGEAKVESNIYGPGEYLLMLMLLVSSVVLIVAMVSIVSAFAKSVKEATMYIMPLYGVTMIVGILSMFKDTAVTDLKFFLLPMYNTVISLSSIFLMDVNPLNIAVCILSNLFYTVILIYVLTRMFDNEKIMFSK
jgi:sodium transport system permease protein